MGGREEGQDSNSVYIYFYTNQGADSAPDKSLTTKLAKKNDISKQHSKQAIRQGKLRKITKCFQGPVSRKSRELFGPGIKYSNRNIKNKSAGPD